MITVYVQNWLFTQIHIRFSVLKERLYISDIEGNNGRDCPNHTIP